MDNLLADNRTKEAKEYLEQYKKLEDHAKMQVPIYEGRIALSEHNAALAEQKFKELEQNFANDGGAMFELAGHYAEQCDYEKALHFYEISFALDKENGKKPLYTDALWGMAVIYEIREKYEEALKCYDRVLKVLDEEFGFTEGAPVDEVNTEKQRVMALMGN